MGTGRVYEDALKPGWLVAAAAALLVGSHVGVAQDPAPKASKADLVAADANPIDSAVFNKMLAGLPQKTFDDAGTPRTFYVWEGDMLLDRDGVQERLFARRIRERPARDGELLLQLRPDGRPGVWRRGNRTLTYAVDCSTFASAQQCAQTDQEVATAAREWENVCRTCGVRFRKVAFVPGMRPTDGAGPRFIVRRDPTAFDFIANAFFANDPAYKRYLDVGPGFFSTSFSRVGILRHELGHVLGYRHEHNRAAGGCYFEDNSWRPLTAYDPQSVMHYFCGGGGTMQLQLTPSDRAGHRTAYGA